MMAKYMLLFASALSISALLGMNAWQSGRYAKLKEEVKRLEAVQAECVEDNKRLLAENTRLSSASNIESIAVTQLGMHKIAPENVTLVTIEGGQGNEF